MKKVLIVVAVLVAVLLIAVATRPATFHVERSLQMNAPADVVFARINDLHAWQDWSPWVKLDPQMKNTYSGPETGKGSVNHWVGDKSGEGQMTIRESTPPSKIDIDLEFIKPFASQSTVVFSISPEGPGSKVTWSMEGTRNFMMKAMSLVADMDKMVGPDFEKGLAQLKPIVEEDAKKKAAAEQEAAAAAAEPADPPAGDAADAGVAEPMH